MKKTFLLFIAISAAFISEAQSGLAILRKGSSIILANSKGERLRLTPYGNYIIRVQTVRKDEDFFSDDRYEMVETNQWTGKLILAEEKSEYKISTEAKDGLSVGISKVSMALSFARKGETVSFLEEKSRTQWNSDTTIQTSFEYDANEHFTGLGHGYFGRGESIDLAGKTINRNYGTEHRQQAPLLVPFYLSDKGYGLFLNSTFPNTFNLGNNGQYQFSIQGDGRMDYFVINGPDFSKIIDRYTQLTGRPRLPLKAFFGLALSDKGNDHNSTDPSDEQWWKKKISAHRNAGYPLDHIVNDNRWRAGGGQRCLSYFDWDTIRYKDPKEYAQWIKSNGLITTLDFNRCIAVQSQGWKPSFNLPQNEGIDFNTSAPDFTKKDVRDWFWNTMWNKSLNPALGYPGDALWIDEFDEMGKAPVTMKFDNGTTWREMRNYWFFLISKSLVQQGWDKSFKGTKRPFVWVRGMTAGAQRYATLWSGDINSTYEDMKSQVIGLQLAGLSGFPFWGHDAGGFHLGDSKLTPDDNMYRQWSMAFGSFTPFWKPHGVGKSRWPLDRSLEVQNDTQRYSELRYKLMPFIYSYAHKANETGLPMARAMVIDYQKDSLAWKSDLQYMWGKEFLVAPNCSDSNNISVWLPKGTWYDFWNDEQIIGDGVINYPAPVGKLPLFVKAGSIIPMAPYALSTAFIPNDSLTIHVYPGKDAIFTMYEDDGVTENYKNKKEKQTTAINFKQSSFSLNISPVTGHYTKAAKLRAYQVVFHGLSKPLCLALNGVKIKNESLLWDADKKTLTISIEHFPVSKSLVLKSCQ